jgi:hypothetical protein
MYILCCRGGPGFEEFLFEIGLTIDSNQVARSGLENQGVVHKTT